MLLPNTEITIEITTIFFFFKQYILCMFYLVIIIMSISLQCPLIKHIKVHTILFIYVVFSHHYPVIVRKDNIYFFYCSCITQHPVVNGKYNTHTHARTHTCTHARTHARTHQMLPFKLFKTKFPALLIRFIMTTEVRYKTS